jgi:hypothetical protein
MSHRSIMLLLVIVAFGALSALALQDVGYFGIIAPHFRSWGGAQVFADLTILAVLFCIWMVRDAHQRGVAAWPFILLTVFLGSFGPLVYLIRRELRAPAEQKALI